jgi:hypothetical protein
VFLSFFFVRAQHKINVKAPEDHQLLEVRIDSVVAAERSVAQINDAESKKFILDTMTMRKDSEVMQTADVL